MSKHTPEPWRVCEPFDGRRGYEIADSAMNRVCCDITEANSRRIVACVNACQGIDTETLDGVAGKNLFSKAVEACNNEYELKKQIDAMLIAMQRLLSSNRHMAKIPTKELDELADKFCSDIYIRERIVSTIQARSVIAMINGDAA